jgi:hypothetical protein
MHASWISPARWRAPLAVRFVMDRSKFALLLLLLCLTPRAAHAEAKEQFGQAGQLVIAADMFLSVLRDETESLTRISIIPAADYFVLDRLSVGGTVSFDYGHFPTNYFIGIGLGPRVGYDLGLSPAFSLWPRAGISWTHAVSSNSSSSLRREIITVGLYVPLLFHLAPQWFVGLGPFLNAQLNWGAGITTYGLRFTIGGWL